MEKQKKQLAVAFMVVLVAVVVVSVIGIIAMSNKPVILQGQIEATEIRISGKLPGRIDTFLVKEGQNVKVGDTLVVINSPEAWAKFRQVNALEDIAKYQNKKIDDGTREQIVRSVEELWNKSKSDLQLAKVTYDRIQNLYRDSVVTSQRKDEVEAVYKAAVAAERAAHQQYLLVKDGAQKEDKESAQLAVTWVRVHAEEYGIDPERLKKCDLHIHAPEGAVPKDGPSAGVTLTTALVSCLSGVPVRGDVAMTGEITLHGNVLPIGGLREKSMAAYREGMKTVLIPKDNEPDLYDVDEEVKKNLTFLPMQNLSQVLAAALLKPKAAKSTAGRPRTKKSKAGESRIPAAPEKNQPGAVC